MLNKWVDDILYQAKGLCLLKKEHHFSLNQALFTLTQSPALNGVMSDAQLQRSESDPRQGVIFFPEMDEPLNTSFTMRDETLLDAAFPMYHHDYYEYPPDHWGRFSFNNDLVAVADVPLTPAAEMILEALKQHDVRYQHLLDSNAPDTDIQYTLLYNPKTLPLPIKEIPGLSMVECSDHNDWLTDHIAMSEHNYGDIKAVWGHRYYSGNDSISNLVVAHTQTGIVGLLKLFNEPTQELWSKTPNPDKLNQHGLSYVSVTPAYRGMGVATQLLSNALAFSLQQGKTLYRTEPSEVGELFLYDHFTRYGQSHYPNVAFVEPGFESITQQMFHTLKRHKVEMSEQSQIVASTLNHIRSKMEPDEKKQLIHRWSNLKEGVLNDAEEYLDKKIEESISKIPSLTK